MKRLIHILLTTFLAGTISSHASAKNCYQSLLEVKNSRKSATIFNAHSPYEFRTIENLSVSIVDEMLGNFYVDEVFLNVQLAYKYVPVEGFDIDDIVITGYKVVARSSVGALMDIYFGVDEDRDNQLRLLAVQKYGTLARSFQRICRTY